MAFLNNENIILDAVLTKRGRELLASGSFEISHFAVSDDGIDYSLINTDHPSGSAFYGELIEELPILEAPVDGNQMLKNKLVTLPQGTEYIPLVNATPNTINLYVSSVGGATVQLETINGSNPSGYIVAAYSPNRIDVTSDIPTGSLTGSYAIQASNIPTTAKRIIASSSFVVTPKALPENTNSNTSLIDVFGIDTGGYVTVSVTVNSTVSTTGGAEAESQQVVSAN